MFSQNYINLMAQLNQQNNQEISKYGGDSLEHGSIVDETFSELEEAFVDLQAEDDNEAIITQVLRNGSKLMIEVQNYDDKGSINWY